jgi:hypothetical protein
MTTICKYYLNYFLPIQSVLAHQLLLKKKTIFLDEVLLEPLEKTKIGPNIIPGIISNLGSTTPVNPQMHPLHMSKRLHLLGWDGFKMEVSAYPHDSENNYQEIMKCFTLFLQLS